MNSNAQLLAQTLYRPPMSLIIMKNTKIIQGELWLGNMKAAKSIKTLKEFQISTVITIANNLDICYVPEDGITHHVYLNILNFFFIFQNYQEAPDIPTFKIQNLFVPVIENITLGLLRGNVFIHCVAGISRSATLVIAYLMSSRGWGYEKALYFVRERRNIKPNPGFLTQLITFSREIQQNLKQIEQKKIQPNPLTEPIEKEQLKITKIQNKIQQEYLNKVPTQIPIPQCNIDLFNRNKEQMSIVQSKSSEKFFFRPNQSGNNKSKQSLQQSSASEYFLLSKSQDKLGYNKEDLNSSMFGRNTQKRQTPCGLYDSKYTIVTSVSNNILDLIVRQTPQQPIKQSQKINTDINKNRNYFNQKPSQYNLEDSFKKSIRESIQIDQYLKYTTPQKENASIEKMRKPPPSASSLYKACYSFL